MGPPRERSGTAHHSRSTWNPAREVMTDVSGPVRSGGTRLEGPTEESGMPEPHLRASDADRAAVADVLGRAMSSGRLTVAEYDDRLARTYAARTYGELAELTADLPVTAPQPTVAPASQPEYRPGGRGMAGCGAGGASMWTGGWGPGAGGGRRRAAWASWLTTAVIVVGIWMLTLAGGWVYPWPLWVIGPWAIILLARTLGGGPGPGRNRQRNRRPERWGG